jgi:hypothetical protein
MTEYFTFNMAIKLQGKWFLPHQQYEIVGTEVIPLVSHQTRSGWPIPQEVSRSLHYNVLRDGDIYTVPQEAGAVLNFEIPQEFVNKYIYEENFYSDNITDYIKAAAKYLNIEIRFRPETAKWYRDSKEVERPKVPIQPFKVGEKKI